VKIKVQVVIESESGSKKAVEEVAVLELDTLPHADGAQRPAAQHTADDGDAPVSKHLAEHSGCSACGKPLERKGKHTILFRTLFGKQRLESLRYYECACQKNPGKQSSSPLTDLLKERTAAEHSYLEAKFVSLVPSGVSAGLLAEILPIGSSISTASLEKVAGQVRHETESPAV
jgi:hypothetical protein